METTENFSDQRNNEKYDEGISYGGVNSTESDQNNNTSDADDTAERLSDYPAGNETDDDKNTDDSRDSGDEDFEEDPEHPETDPSKLDKL